MTGGGARVNWEADPSHVGQIVTPFGNLLTGSYPDGKHAWAVRAKDHIKVSPASVTVYVISLKARNGAKLTTAIFTGQSQVSGAPAASAFRLERLRERLVAIDPRVAALHARHVHFVDCEPTFDAAGEARLCFLPLSPSSTKSIASLRSTVSSGPTSSPGSPLSHPSFWERNSRAHFTFAAPLRNGNSDAVRAQPPYHRALWSF